MRNFDFINGEIYHIYCRGVDKRHIFEEEQDLGRFIQSILEFNDINPIGSIHENSFNKNGNKIVEKQMVKFVAYCINPNHFHFILRQETDGGISKFMHKLLLGYTLYFNKKYKRTGSLFSSKFKAKYVNTDDYLLHLSAYVNLNFLVHKIKLGDSVSKFVRSSWKQYIEENLGRPLIPCDVEEVFKNFKSKEEYREYAEETLKEIIGRREEETEETGDGLIE